MFIGSFGNYVLGIDTMIHTSLVLLDFCMATNICLMDQVAISLLPESHTSKARSYLIIGKLLDLALVHGPWYNVTQWIQPQLSV